METRHLAHIAQTYAPKNKLTEAIAEGLEEFDKVLFPDLKTAKKTITGTFLSLVGAYIKLGGKAQLPDLREYEITNGAGISVEGCIIFHLYAVKEEITN